MGALMSILCFFLPFLSSCTPPTPEPTFTPTIINQEPWEVGLIHRYSGEGNANDSVGGAVGTLGSTTAFKTGRKGLAFEFNGLSSSMVNPMGCSIDISTLPSVTSKVFDIVDCFESPFSFAVSNIVSCFTRRTSRNAREIAHRTESPWLGTFQ